MAIVVSGSEKPGDAAQWAARFASGSLAILGPASAGSRLLATLRVPVVAPFTADATGMQKLSGAWFGTVREAGRAESFRFTPLEGDLAVTGSVSGPGGGGDLILDPPSLAYGLLVDLTFGRLVMKGSELSLALAGTARVAQPKGQRFKVHWESWADHQTPAYPEKLYLTQLPAYVDTVTLCFARPQFRYERLSDDVFITTGLRFDGTGHQLKNALDLLRLRRPNIRIALAVQQGGPFGPNGPEGFEPYDQNGWGGMNSGHLASMRRFVDDMGIHEIDVDYECVSRTMDEDHHCRRTADGKVWCYTDGELVRVVKAFRERFPRPRYRLAFDAYNTGAYFGPFARQKPIGWNHGYVAALTKDPHTRDALDVVNIMSFDEQAGYDPVRALEAYRHAFPKAEVYLGFRSGPPWQGSRSLSLFDCRDEINATIRLGTAGIWLYSLLWDVAEPTPPYGPDHPDTNMMAKLVAERFHLPDPDQQLVELPSPGAKAP